MIRKTERERIADLVAMDQAYVECRTFGHAWYQHEGNVQNGVTPVLLRCERCTTVRYDEYGSNTGDLVSRSYQYPDGYKNATATKGKTKSDWRLSFLLKVGLIK